MSLGVHPTALVDPSAEVAPRVVIGPYAVVGPQVTLGEGCRIGARASVERNARLGREVTVGVGSVVGGDPQDLKFAGEETWVEIGDRTVIREYATINRGTAALGVTRVGSRCVLMSYVHVAHDCQIGDDVIVSNCTQLAGHVIVHEGAILSGLVGVHQFARIGALAFVGGMSRVTQDIPPFCKAAGNPVRLFGLNAVGLRRAGFPKETVSALKRAYRLCFNSDLPLAEAQGRVRRECPPLPEVDRFLEFVVQSQRGVPV